MRIILCAAVLSLALPAVAQVVSKPGSLAPAGTAANTVNPAIAASNRKALLLQLETLNRQKTNTEASIKAFDAQIAALQAKQAAGTAGGADGKALAGAITKKAGLERTLAGITKKIADIQALLAAT